MKYLRTGKKAIANQVIIGGATVSEVAKINGLSAKLVSKWKRAEESRYNELVAISRMKHGKDMLIELLDDSDNQISRLKDKIDRLTSKIAMLEEPDETNKEQKEYSFSVDMGNGKWRLSRTVDKNYQGINDVIPGVLNVMPEIVQVVGNFRSQFQIKGE